jgi:hypothetical protein
VLEKKAVIMYRMDRPRTRRQSWLRFRRGSWIENFIAAEKRQELTLLKTVRPELL